MPLGSAPIRPNIWDDYGTQAPWRARVGAASERRVAPAASPVAALWSKPKPLDLRHVGHGLHLWNSSGFPWVLQAAAPGFVLDLLLTKQSTLTTFPYEKRGTDRVEGGQTLAATAANANPMVPPTRVSLTKCFPPLTSDQWPTNARAARGTKAAGAS
jgi:hypothetical protein